MNLAPIHKNHLFSERELSEERAGDAQTLLYIGARARRVAGTRHFRSIAAGFPAATHLRLNPKSSHPPLSTLFGPPNRTLQTGLTHEGCSDSGSTIDNK